MPSRLISLKLRFQFQLQLKIVEAEIARLLRRGPPEQCAQEHKCKQAVICRLCKHIVNMYIIICIYVYVAPHDLPGGHADRMDTRDPDIRYKFTFVS